MYKIVTRKQLNDSVVLMEIDAPYIAAKAEAGQFITELMRRASVFRSLSLTMTEKRALSQLFSRW